MFIVQCVRPDRTVRYTDVEWDYHNDEMNWNRAFSFLPLNGKLWIDADGFGNVTIQYSWS